MESEMEIVKQDIKMLQSTIHVAHAVVSLVVKPANTPPRPEALVLLIGSETADFKWAVGYHLPSKHRKNLFDGNYDGDDVVYDEEEDEYYWPDGYYFGSLHDSIDWRIDISDVLGWCELPKVPIGEMRAALEKDPMSFVAGESK
jgi:hypothetical protein